MGSDGIRQVTIVFANGVKRLHIFGDASQTSSQVNREVRVENENTQRTENARVSVIINDVEDHLIYDKGLVLQWEFNGVADRGSCGPGECGDGHDQLWKVKLQAIIALELAQPWLALGIHATYFGPHTNVQRGKIENDLAVTKRICGDEFKLAATS